VRTLPVFTVIPYQYSNTCTSFEYSSWSDCVSGHQTRNITASFPSGCTGGTPAALTQTCSSTITPACGTVQSFVTVPTDPYALCSVGTPTTPSLNGSIWTWTCTGSTNITCTATNPYVVTPVCGSANGQMYSAAPVTTELCNPGTASNFTSSNPWVWTCSGSSGTTQVTCSTIASTVTSLPALTISSEQNASAANYYHIKVLADKPGMLRSVKIRAIPPTTTNSTLDYTIAYPVSGSQAERWEVDLALPSETVARSWTVRVVSYEYNLTGETTSRTYNYEANYPSVTISVPASTPSTCTSFEYSSWSTCSSSGTQTRTITHSYPTNCTGGQPSALTQTCTPTTNTNCYTDWSICDSSGHQTRALITPLPSGCTTGDTNYLTRTCTATEMPVCAYSFSSWTVCENGKQTRTITSKVPAGCRENLTEPLERTCTTTSNQVPNTQQANPTTTAATCVYTYGGWGDCINGKQFRSVIYKSPEGCVPGTTPAITEQSCRTSTATNPIEVISSKLNEVTSINPAPSVTTLQVPVECSNAGITDGNDCQIYLYQMKVVKECLANNLTTLDQCRQYFLDKYGKPLKCDGLDQGKCDYIINEVILSDIKDTVSAQDQKILSDSGGSTAVVNTQTNTITIAPTEDKPTEPATEVKVESLPLSSANGDVSVNLIASTLTNEQQPLVPVVIAIDNNKNGVPDDMEARLNIAPKSREEVDVSKLTGIDKAILEGKPLEQPKLNSSVTVSTALQVEAIENTKTANTPATEKNSVKFSGKAKPNQVVTLYIYSAMPIVLTVKADANGNWVYNLDKTLVNGKHEVYVAINNDKGRIVESSLPKPFFIEEAQAVSMDEFAGIQDASSVPDQTNMYLIFYIMGGLIAVLVLVAIFLMVKQRNAE
jgi:hypothetical protein